VGTPPIIAANDKTAPNTQRREELRRCQSSKSSPLVTPLQLKQRLGSQFWCPMLGCKPVQLGNFAGLELVNVALICAMCEPGAVVPRRPHERHQEISLLFGPPALAEEASCDAEERYSDCNANGDADVRACREGAVGRRI
jgi:hypothetical protein